MHLLYSTFSYVGFILLRRNISSPELVQTVPSHASDEEQVSYVDEVNPKNDDYRRRDHSYYSQFEEECEFVGQSLPDSQGSATVSINVCPNNISPLSMFDTEVSKKWNGKMTLTSDDTSITYTSAYNGQLLLTIEDNFVVIKRLCNMSVFNVTPESIIKALKEGEMLDYTAEPGQVLLVNASTNQPGLFTAQDSLYFYSKGVYPGSVDLLPLSQFEENLMDYVQIGLAPRWFTANNYEPFQPAPNPVPFLTRAFHDDVEELANYAMSVLTKQPVSPISTENKVARMKPTFSDKVSEYPTVLDQIKGLYSIETLSGYLFYNPISTPALLNVYTKTAIILQNADDPRNYRDLWGGELGNTNLIIYGDQIDNHNYINIMSGFIQEILFLDAEPDYKTIQSYCSESMEVLTLLLLYINNHVLAD